MKLVRIFFIFISFIFISSAGFASVKPVTLKLKWKHQFQFAGFYAAKEKGFYKEKGIDIKILEGYGENSYDQVESGKIDFALSGTGVLIERSKGRPFVALGVIYQTSPYIWLVRKDSGIKSPKDFIGKKIMFQPGSVDGAELMAIFARQKIPLESMTLLKTSQNVNDLADGKVDGYTAFIANEPYVLQRKGVAYSTIRPSTYGLDFYGDVLFTSEQIINSSPNLVKNFREASFKGWEYAFEHMEEMITLIMDKYNTQDKTYSHLKYEAIELEQLSYRRFVKFGHMKLDRWKHIEDTFVDLGMMNNRVDLNEFIYHKSDSYVWLKSLATLFGILLIFLIIKGYFSSKKVRKLYSQASTDALTGLTSRRYFFESGDRLFHQYQRNNSPLSMLVLDIDFFKKVNDTFGHDGGDEALKVTANGLKEHIRKSDLLGRIGGEEFSVLLADTDMKGAKIVAEKIRADIEKLELFWNEKKIPLSISIGCSQLKKSDKELSDLFGRADQALYKAKELGRNRVETIW